MSQNSQPALVPAWGGVYPPEKFKNAFVIGIAGFIGSGKTTIAEAILEELKSETSFKSQRLAFSDRLKETLAALVGQDLDFISQDSKRVRVYGGSDWLIRDFLTQFATEFVRERIGPEFWVDVIANQLAALSEPSVLVNDSTRFPNEIKFVNALGISVRLERDGVVQTVVHASEDVGNLAVSGVISNNDNPQTVAREILALARSNPRWPGRAS